MNSRQILPEQLAKFELLTPEQKSDCPGRVGKFPDMLELTSKAAICIE